MEDIRQFILSLKEVGLYKARVEEDGKELIFSGNKFVEKTLPVKVKTFDETEEMTAVDLEKEKKIAREKEGLKLEVVQKGEIEEEGPESYRVGTSKKLFRAAIFIIPILVAGLIYLLNNPLNKNGKGFDLTPQKTETAIPGEKTVAEQKTETDTPDKQTGEKTDESITTGEPPQQTPEKPALTGGDKSIAKIPDETTGTTTAVTEDIKKSLLDTKKPGIKTKNEAGEQKIETAKPPVLHTVKIIQLPTAIIKEYNGEFGKLILPFIPVRIRVAGYLNIKVSIDEKGKAAARILSSEALQVTPEERRENVLNLIIKKISSIKLTPPQDKQGKPVRVSEFSIDYQAGKLGTKLILKKR